MSINFFIHNIPRMFKKVYVKTKWFQMFIKFGIAFKLNNYKFLNG